MYIKKMLFEIGTLTAILSPINAMTGVISHNYFLQQGIQHDIYMLGTKYEELNQKPGVLNYKEMKTSIGSVTKHQLGIEVDEQPDLDVSLKIISNNSINKSVDVIYIINKKGFKEATGIITIYAKDRVPNPDYDDIQFIIRELQQIQITSHGNLYPDKWKAGDEITADELGIVEPKNNGADIIYIIKSIDLETGEVLVNTSITKGIETDNFKIKITGYKTFKEQNDEDLTKVLEEIKDEVETSKPIFPKWKIGDKFTPQNLGINKIETNDKINIEYEIKEISDDTGEVVVQIKVTSDDKTFVKDTKITGFETKNQKDKKALDKVMEKVTDETSTLISEFPDWKIGDVVSREKLGIKDLDVDLGDVTVEYKIKDLIPKTGNVIVEVTGTINDKTETKEITVSGFKSQDEKNNELVSKVKEIIVNKYQNVNLLTESPWIAKLPEEAQKKFTEYLTDENLKELNIPVLDEEEKETTTLNYKIISVDNDSGTAKVEVVITKDNVSTVASFNINGFENAENYNRKLIEKSYQQIQNKNNLSEEKNVINLVSDSIYSTKLPSKIKINVGEILNSSQLRDLNIILLEDSRIKIESEVKDINDQNGTMKVVISITSGNAKKQLTVIVNGFRTKSEQDKLDVSNLKSYMEDKYKDVKIANNSKDKTFLPSEIKNELGTESLTQENIERLGIEFFSQKILKEATVNYKIISVNDGSGQISIKIEITQGSIKENFIFQVKGFQTSNQRNQVEVDEAITKFKNNNQNPQIDEKSVLAKKTVSENGYKKGTTIVGNQLNNLNLNINNDDIAFEWDFKVKEVDDQNGTLTIELVINKGFAEAKTVIMINGFLKQA